LFQFAAGGAVDGVADSGGAVVAVVVVHVLFVGLLAVDEKRLEEAEPLRGGEVQLLGPDGAALALMVIRDHGGGGPDVEPVVHAAGEEVPEEVFFFEIEDAEVEADILKADRLAAAGEGNAVDADEGVGAEVFDADGVVAEEFVDGLAGLHGEDGDAELGAGLIGQGRGCGGAG
jgi:hypothetical protein